MAITPVTIREYAEGDEQGINDLFNRAFSTDRPLQEWYQRFRDNPALREVTEPNTTIVAEKDGVIVGNYSSLLVNMTCGEDIVKTIQVVDTMVDPAQKIGLKMLRKLFLGHLAKVDRIALIGFGFPNKTAHVVGNKLFGYMDLVCLVHRFKTLSFKGSVKRQFPKAPDWLLSFVHTASRLFVRVPTPEANRYTLEQTPRFGQETDKLWEKVKHRFEIATVRTSVYLNWRYKDQEFVSLLARCSGEVAGYVVLKIEEDEEGILIGKIIDLLYDEDSASAFLLSAALRYFIDHGADCALYGSLPGDPLEKQLSQAGFTERKGVDPLPVVWMPLTDELDRKYISNPSNWHLVYGDIDGF